MILLLAMLWAIPATRADGTGQMTVYCGADADGFRDLYGRIGADGCSRAKRDY